MTFCNARIKCKEVGLATPSSSALFEDFQNWQGVWTHPLALKKQKQNIDEPVTSDEEENSADDDSEDETSDESDGDSETNSDNDSMYLFIYTDIFFAFILLTIFLSYPSKNK